MEIFKKHIRTAPKQWLGALVIVVVVASVSLMVRASTPTGSSEAESGSLSSCASKIDDTSASAGQAVEFASCDSSFVHPGVLLSKSQLDLVKNKIASNTQPWAGELTKAEASSLGSTSYTPHPVASVSCVKGQTNSDCDHEQNDAEAAYLQALLWYYTGNDQYAQGAMNILNAWSSTLTAQTGDNTFLQAAWVSIPMTQAAEILRYSNSGWSPADIQQFTDMLDNVFIPQVKDIWSGGGANVLATRIEATMEMAVFENDRDLFNTAVSQWQEEVPSMIYLSTDTNNDYPRLQGLGYPKPPIGVSWATSNVSPATMDTYWYNPSQYESGLEGETCRDMSHATFGLDAIVDSAETAYIQGVNLYTGDNLTRMVDGYEFNAQYFAQQLSSGSVPSWLCGGTISAGGTGYELGYEIAYNALHGRLGKTMPYTKAFIDNYTRPSGYKAGLFMNWETLTSASTQ